MQLRTPIILSCLLALAAPAAAAETLRGISASYNVDVGSMTMMAVRFASSFSSGAVRSEAVIKSKGISAVFSEYSARAEAESRLGGEAIEPALFELSRERDGRTKKTMVQWDDGGAITIEPPAHRKPEKRARIENALTPGVSDPVTAILRVGTAGENPCAATQRVFDGRDVFDLILSDAGPGVSKNGSAYQGPVRNCRVRWHAVAGRSAEKNEPDGVYDASFAPIGTLESGQTMWFPVALKGTIKGLDFKVYVTKFRVDGGQQVEPPAQN